MGGCNIARCTQAHTTSKPYMQIELRIRPNQQLYKVLIVNGTNCSSQVVIITASTTLIDYFITPFDNLVAFIHACRSHIQLRRHNIVSILDRVSLIETDGK